MDSVKTAHPALYLRARLCIVNFRSRLGDGDRFDDWVVGRQFVPDYLQSVQTARFRHGAK